MLRPTVTAPHLDSTERVKSRAVLALPEAVPRETEAPEAASIIRLPSSEVLWPPLVVLLLGCRFRLHVPQSRPQRRRHVFDQLRVCANAERARVHHEAIDPDGASQ